MQNLHNKLPYELINYIYSLKAALLIQRTFRKNRPQILLTSTYTTIMDDKMSVEYTKWRGYTDFYAGDRVLIRLPSGKYRYGTVNIIYPPKQEIKCIIRPVKNITENLYVYFNPEIKMILLPPWRDREYMRSQMRDLTYRSCVICR